MYCSQVEDPSALFATLKAMVGDRSYHPDNQARRAAAIREQKFREVAPLLTEVQYWQFRFRLYLARRYNYIREEVSFIFGVGSSDLDSAWLWSWSVL